ncbi:MAG: NAD(P)H-binding protein [Actinophytocola sp.]|nr:NAD(P)H-binding protein [Actinophytocola sp.]
MTAANATRIVAVTGATGRQGGAVTRHLLTAGWRVRAITRSPDSVRARQLVELGADVVKADMDDLATLLPAFHQVYGVYSVQNPMISGHDGEIAQGINVADAALEAGARHLVYGSAGIGVVGTGVDSWESKLIIHGYMRNIGLPVTALRPMAFLELMTDKSYYPAVSTWHVMPKLMGAERPVPWLSVDDLGAIAARVFADPARFIGAELCLAADVRTLRECAEIWREVKGRAPRRFPMPTWLFERMTGTDLTTMWRWLRTGRFDFDTAETLRLLPEAASVRTWLSARQPQRT